MSASRVFRTAQALARRLRRLHDGRRSSRQDQLDIRDPRRALSLSQRREVLEKTGGRCHICGGKITRGSRWAADHILQYAHGGVHDVSNYLPAHGYCNKYRRAYQPEEFQWILKLGIWFRTQIAKEVPLAMELAERFVKHEARRDQRRVLWE